MKIYKVTLNDTNDMYIDGTFVNDSKEYYTSSFVKAEDKYKSWKKPYENMKFEGKGEVIEEDPTPKCPRDLYIEDAMEWDMRVISIKIEIIEVED